jgi:hypothetical protein
VTMIRYAKRSVDGIWERGDRLECEASRTNRHGWPLQVVARTDAHGRREEIRSTVESDEVQDRPIFFGRDGVQS